MKRIGVTTSDLKQSVILRTADERDLQRILEDEVQAVIYTPDSLPSWLKQVAPAVESGDLSIQRAVLPNHTRNEVEGWLAEFLPDGNLAPHVRDCLVDDILGLTDRLAATSGVSRFRVRIFTEAPTADCGFHIDTVAPGAPPWGLLRVYNGAGTAFVEPANLVSLALFHEYLNRRERLEREWRTARRHGDAVLSDRLEHEVERLDAERAFLIRRDEVFLAQTASIVAFKHVDLRYHWAPDDKSRAWIHCSPMQGARRLVVNVTSPESVQHRSR